MTQNNINFNNIVNTSERRVEVCAGPGCLKTTALLARIPHLISNGASPQNILVLTYSNSTVEEIRGRLKAQANTDALHVAMERVQVSTCHKFSYDVISAADPHGNVLILSAKQAHDRLLLAVELSQKKCQQGELWATASPSLRQRRLDTLAAMTKHLRLVLRLIDFARASTTTTYEVLDSGRFNELTAYRDVLGAVRNEYNKVKVENGEVDYTDMLLRATRLIDKGLEPIPYTHLLVDEYQDCSAGQVQLLCALAKLPGRSIMVFGDADQTIYGFSGTTYTPLHSMLPKVVEMPLPNSQRLTNENAALASAVMQHSPHQMIRTTRSGERPRLVRSRSWRMQVTKTLEDIQSKLVAGTSPGQIVLLARNKGQLRPFEQALLTEGIDSERKGVARSKDNALPVLQLVNQLQKRESLTHADARTLLTDFVLHHQLTTTDHRITGAATTFHQASLSRSLEGRYMVCSKVYLTLLGGSRKNDELRNDINRWAPLCRGRQSAREMRDFINAMSGVGITTSSIHGAKGGTWEHVFIVGATDGLLPFYRQSHTDSELLEERRLLYVATTRASQSVNLYHAPTHLARSGQLFTKVSRHLNTPQVLKTLTIEQA